MLIKIVTLLLIAMGGMAVYFKMRMGGKHRRLAKPATCPKCGRHRIGTGPCPCGAPEKKG